MERTSIISTRPHPSYSLQVNKLEPLWAGRGARSALDQARSDNPRPLPLPQGAVGPPGPPGKGAGSLGGSGPPLPTKRPSRWRRLLGVRFLPRPSAPWILKGAGLQPGSHCCQLLGRCRRIPFNLRENFHFAKLNLCLGQFRRASFSVSNVH